MKSTLILKNIGNQPSAEVTVQVSYFVKFKESSQVKTQEFILTVKSNQEHRQEIDFGDSRIKELEVLVLVQKPKGNIITQKSFVLQDIADKTPLISFALNEEIDIETAPPIEMPKPNFVYGRLLDKKGIHNMEDIQIIISAKRDGENDFETMTSVTTEAQGYFSIEYPLGNFTEAVALVGLELAENPIPIRLSKKVVNQSGDPTTVLVFPPRMILIAELKEAIVSTEDAQDCGCSANEFGEKKVLEEFSFYSLVRTSEPVIKGYVIEDEDEITLEDVLRNLPYSVFEIIEPLKAFPYISRKSPIRLMKAAVEPAIARAVSDDDNFLETIKNIKIKKSVLNNFIKDEHTITKDNIAKLFAQNEAFVFYNTINDIEPANPKPLGRVELGIDNAIDWDDEPTIYQAVTVAHGHLLQYKSEWIADGYSLGDLLYSLPLAPGQKKQIVVFDWERRESASNSQSIDFEESLSSSLSRDRDILEIAKGTIHENVKGNSSASVAGIAGGVGGYVGVVFGVAGGYSNARSSASQDSLRQVSSSDQQKLSDKIVQSANAVRSMRSTVIQTVAQGERFEVSSESVANYNHCHALTIQYYEVLRHFKIRQRFAGARECLFVPLLMSQFDLKKSLRWRESLQLALIDRRLAKGFDAGDRILHEWQDSNFPSGTFASESIITASGVLQIRFVLQRPVDKIVEVDDLDRPPLVASANLTVWHKKKVSEIIPANWQKLTPFLDGISPAEFHKDYLEGATDKDAVFHQMIGEKVAREFIRNLVFDVEDSTGRSIGNIPIDTSITSRYARNGMLRVTLRLNQPTSFARDKFHYLRIKTKIITGSIFGVNIPVNLGDILPDGSYMTVESGFMRYKTNHFDGFLFKYQDLGDDLTATDGVTIYAGPSSEELKDPRKEDLVVANKLIAHLNDNLEYYHKAIWLNMTAQRRFMLLDGIILNQDEKEKGGGRSVASLVENDLISIVGNSLVFPVAPGLNLNPDFGMKESLTEFYMTAAAEPISISVPTKGVFAEAVMGKCNSCEKIEEDRFWRWEESPIPDSPTAINPINTDTRRADPGNLQPQALPNPIVNIQNAPNAPDPSGLSATLGLLGQSNIFKDITGLEGNQKNAMQAFQSSLDAAKTFAQEAGKLEVQKVMEKRLDKAINAIDNDKSLSPEKKAELKEKALNAYMGAGATKEEPQDESQSKPTLTDAVINAADEGKEVKAKSTDINTGKSEEIEIGRKEDSLTAIPSEVWADIEKFNSPLKRTFFPDSNDKSGIIEVEAIVFDAPLGAKFKWSSANTDRVKIDTPEQLKTKIYAGKPGITPLSFDIFNSNDRLLRHTSVYLGVPQFFIVCDSRYPYNQIDSGGRTIPNPHTFDSVLDSLSLKNEKKEIVKKIKTHVESRLIRKNVGGAISGNNVRLLWQLGSFNDPILENLTNPHELSSPTESDGYCSFISISGYPQKDLNFGLTIPNPANTPSGPTSFNETIFIFTGLFELFSILPTPTSGVQKDINEKVKKLIQSYKADLANSTLKQLIVEIFSRLYADVICHEIYHSIIYHKHDAALKVTDQGFDDQGHTLPPTKDIMSKDRNFLERTGIEVTDMSQFPNANSMIVHPFANYSVLSKDNATRADIFFPVPPTPPFDE